ncbi:MAG: MBL fold metallo-hydrolase [Tepidisphaerales bacterium]
MIEKSFLVQKFAKLQLGAIHIIGYSVAGEESVVQVPELDVCFDIGRAPYFSLTSNHICITHGHMDHLAGLAYYLSQRNFQGMKPGIILIPAELADPVDAMLRCWRAVERQDTPYTIVPMSRGQDYAVRKDYLIRAIETHHAGPSLGYALISVREKLKPEYMGIPGQELAAMRKKGVEIQYRTEIPLVAYLGDTTIGPVFEHPDVRTAEVLITECTFFDPAHRNRAKIGRHLHIDHFVDLLPTLKNQQIVLTHVSRRTSLRRAKAALRKRIGDEAMERVHFLMDFEGSADAGDVEQAGPPPSETAE